MASRTSRARLAQVAFWYYVQDRTQQEIAGQLGVSRSNVSRLLRAAREEGVVSFGIDYPLERDGRSERLLMERFGHSGLREAVVASRVDDLDGTGRGSPALLAVARAAVDWMAAGGLRDGIRLGLSWGGTIQTLVDVFHVPRRFDVHVVQLAGELSLDSRSSGHDLVRDLAIKLGGSYTYFNAPAVTPSAATVEALTATHQVSEAMALARGADMALLGIGQFATGSTEVFLRQAGATPEEVREANLKGVVGQALGRFFDATGAQVDLEIHRRTISLELADLMRIPIIVIVASGQEKREAVAAALRAGWINVLIVDSGLAGTLLDSGDGPSPHVIQDAPTYERPTAT